MDLEQVFYVLAVLFGIAAIVYFAWEYLDILPRITKAALLGMLAIALFLLAQTIRANEEPTKIVRRMTARRARS